MFIHPPNIQNLVEKTGLTGLTRQEPVAEREQRRYQYLFQSTPLHKDKSLYRHVVAMVNHFIGQVMGRQEEQGHSMSKGRAQEGIAPDNKPRQVRGIADRMPRLVDPDNPQPGRDSVFLGEAKDYYPAAVIGIEFNHSTKPVFYEGNQIVARHLELDCKEHSVSAQVILNNGGRIPVEIMIFTAV